MGFTCTDLGVAKIFNSTAISTDRHELFCGHVCTSDHVDNHNMYTCMCGDTGTGTQALYIEEH